MLRALRMVQRLQAGTARTGAGPRVRGARMAARATAPRAMQSAGSVLPAGFALPAGSALLARSVLPVPPAQPSRRTLQPVWLPTPISIRLLLTAATVAASLLAQPLAARAAMNFCAAPALQASERTGTAPGARAFKAFAADVLAHAGDQPHPLARLRADDREALARAQQEFDLMRDAALAWRATGDERYLGLVNRFLLAWVTTYQPSFAPLDESGLDSLILAYDMTASALPVKTRNASMAFLNRLAGGYLAQVDAQPRPLRGDFANDRQSQRVKLIAMAAFTLDNRRMVAAAQRLFVEHIGDNIAPDGTTLDFAAHGSLRDTVQDLQPLVDAALAARQHNRNWLRERAANGTTLALALDWLVPYALGNRTHDEPADPPSSASLGTGTNAASAAASNPWNPKSAARLFHLTARLDGRYVPIARQLSATPPVWLLVCLPLPAR